jgi:hypothetical protein
VPLLPPPPPPPPLQPLLDFIRGSAWLSSTASAPGLANPDDDGFAGGAAGAGGAAQAAATVSDAVAVAAAELSAILATQETLDVDTAQDVTSFVSSLIEAEAGAAGDGPVGERSSEQISAAVMQLARAVTANPQGGVVELKSSHLNLTAEARPAAALSARPVMCDTGSERPTAASLPPDVLDAVAGGSVVDPALPVSVVLFSSRVNLHATSAIAPAFTATATTTTSATASSTSTSAASATTAATVTTAATAVPTTAAPAEPSSSSMVSFSLLQRGAELRIQGAASRINVSIPFTPMVVERKLSAAESPCVGQAEEVMAVGTRRCASVIECHWWDESLGSGKWSTAGCVTLADGGAFTCSCDHLTDFIVFEFPLTTEALLDDLSEAVSINGLSAEALRCFWPPSFESMPGVWLIDACVLLMAGLLLAHASKRDDDELRMVELIVAGRVIERQQRLRRVVSVMQRRPQPRRVSSAAVPSTAEGGLSKLSWTRSFAAAPAAAEPATAATAAAAPAAAAPAAAAAALAGLIADTGMLDAVHPISPSARASDDEGSSPPASPPVSPPASMALVPLRPVPSPPASPPTTTCPLRPATTDKSKISPSPQQPFDDGDDGGGGGDDSIEEVELEGDAPGAACDEVAALDKIGHGAVVGAPIGAPTRCQPHTALSHLLVATPYDDEDDEDEGASGVDVGAGAAGAPAGCFSCAISSSRSRPPPLLEKRSSSGRQHTPGGSVVQRIGSGLSRGGSGLGQNLHGAISAIRRQLSRNRSGRYRELQASEHWRKARRFKSQIVLVNRWWRDVNACHKRMWISFKGTHTLLAGVVFRGASGYTRAQTVQMLLSSLALEMAVLCMFYSDPSEGAVMVINPVKIVAAGAIAATICIPGMLVFGWLFQPIGPSRRATAPPRSLSCTSVALLAWRGEAAARSLFACRPCTLDCAS